MIEKTEESDSDKETFIKNHIHDGTPETQDVCFQEYRARMSIHAI